MRFYTTECGKLISFNPETKVYRHRNNVKKESQLVTKEVFDTFISIEIKRQKFSRLMNEYFNNIKDEWKWEYERFKKLPNFEIENGGIINYDLNKLPTHKSQVRGDCIMVYHWGRVYLHHIMYQGEFTAQLECIKTGKLVRWAHLKHCAPIKNIGTDKII